MPNKTPNGAPRTGVHHHFVHGLRFDTMWSYQVRLGNGRKDWIRLNLAAHADTEGFEVDPEGAMWCVRCCASVLAQRPTSQMRLHKLLTVEADGGQVAAALAALLPGFDVEVQSGLIWELLRDTHQLIHVGGSMLVRLERARSKLRPLPCWMWVVGVEVRTAEHDESGVLAPEPLADTPALLLVGRGLEPSWASGYGVKAICSEDAIWSVRSVDGQTWSGVLNCVVRICPR
nr:hypothetical protein [Comamonas koreensis]